MTAQRNRTVIPLRVETQSLFPAVPTAQMTEQGEIQLVSPFDEALFPAQAVPAELSQSPVLPAQVTQYLRRLNAEKKVESKAVKIQVEPAVEPLRKEGELKPFQQRNGLLRRIDRFFD